MNRMVSTQPNLIQMISDGDLAEKKRKTRQTQISSPCRSCHDKMSRSSDQRYRSVIKCTTDTKLSSKFIVENFADEFASLILDVEIKNHLCPFSSEQRLGEFNSTFTMWKINHEDANPLTLGVDHFKWKDKKITPQKVVVFFVWSCHASFLISGISTGNPTQPV